MEASVIEPISASADGKRNGYSLFCDTKGQRMSYAACLWRQGVLDNPATKTPEDWQSCRTAACAGKCNAKEMRKEEEIAGKSIYFVCRNACRKLADVAKDWGIVFRPSKSAEPRQSTLTSFEAKPVVLAPVVRKDPASALDALSSVDTYSDAITAAAKEQSVVFVKKEVVSVSATGETPLQMARRLNAAKAA